jgi:sec-independent protein translocase protein TatB
MLFDFGWSEILLIGVVALVVIGPKDMPKALRVAGYWMRKARALSQEFHNSVEEVMREAELAEMRQELKKATEIDLDAEFERRIEPDGSLAPQLEPPQLPEYPPPAYEAEAAAEAEQPELPGLISTEAAPARPLAPRDETSCGDPVEDAVAAAALPKS